MLAQYREMELKKQIITILCFILGYFSPLSALVVFFFLRWKQKARIYQRALLCGGGIAMGFYLLSTLSYFFMV